MTQPREIRAACLGAAVLLAYAALVLASGRVELVQFAKLVSVYLAGSFGLWAMIGGGAMVASVLIGARRSGDQPFLKAHLLGFLHDRWNGDRFVSMLWPPLLFGALIATFNAYKQMILPSSGFGLDPAFRAADSLLFFGTDPWRVTHAIFGSPQATIVIDRLYHGWFLPMSLGLVACAWLPRSSFQLRTQYILSYIAVWIGIGSILAFAMPSAGPCFYSHFHGADASFDELSRRLADAQFATGAKLNALANQEALLGLFGGNRLAIGGGISAMPSVHNALAVLFMLAAFRINRAFGWAAAAYAVLIWIGSVHLGWHYAVDGIAAAFLTIAIWHVCGRIAARLERPLTGMGPEPALA